MTFWQWANRKSESLIEFVLKLILAIIIIIVFAWGLFYVARLNLDDISRPQLTVDSCGSEGVAQSLQELFVEAYNQQAWSGHLLPSDVALSQPRATNLRSDIDRVECRGAMTAGMHLSMDRRITLPVNYSVYRQAGSNQLLVQYNYQNGDFVGKGLSGAARRGTKRSDS